jgi:hypothetical protein
MSSEVVAVPVPTDAFLRTIQLAAGALYLDDEDRQQVLICADFLDKVIQPPPAWENICFGSGRGFRQFVDSILRATEELAEQMRREHEAIDISLGDKGGAE